MIAPGQKNLKKNGPPQATQASPSGMCPKTWIRNMKKTYKKPIKNLCKTYNSKPFVATQRAEAGLAVESRMPEGCALSEKNLKKTGPRQDPQNEKNLNKTGSKKT